MRKSPFILAVQFRTLHMHAASQHTCDRLAVAVAWATMTAHAEQVAGLALFCFAGLVMALALGSVVRQPTVRRGKDARRALYGRAWALVVALLVFGLSTFQCVVYASGPSRYTGLVVTSMGVELAAWALCSIAMVTQLLRASIATCSVPCFWALSLTAKVYAVAGVDGYMPNDSAAIPAAGSGYSSGAGPLHPLASADTTAVVVWVSLATQVCAVVLACCCCALGIGVHEDITTLRRRRKWAAADGGRGTTPGAGTAVAASRSLEVGGKSNANEVPLLAEAQAVTDSRVDGAAKPQAAAVSRVQAGLKPREVLQPTSMLRCCLAWLRSPHCMLTVPLRPQVESFYDSFGKMQDSEALYTDKAQVHMRRLVGPLLARARVVVEIGCGTGALAEKLLRHNLSDTCRYDG